VQEYGVRIHPSLKSLRSEGLFGFLSFCFRTALRDMSEPHQFRHYLIVQDVDGSNVELERSAEKVAVLAFDTVRLEFVACHVLLQAVAEKAAFEETCRRLRGHGHPLLARMVDFGEDEGNPFYITGAADGEPLRAYLNRQQELPGWLAVMLASRALDAAAAVCSRGDCLPQQPLNSLRVVQVGTQSLVVIASDYRLTPAAASTAARTRAQRANFDKQGKFLRAFLLEQAGVSATLPDHPLSAADFTELLAGCLDTASPVAVPQMIELRNSLLKLAPEHLSGEIPAPQKPRALIAPLLASYQDVARAVVNRVRIQSQRLDMTNPYSMRGTLTKAGRPVLVEQIPPARVVGRRLQEAAVQLQKLTRKNEHPHLATVAMVHEADSVTCLAEEIVEGISLAELLKERTALEVQEAYLVLAGLDSALADLDSTHLPTHKLRLEDLFLLIGGSREDPRSSKLLNSKLNDWPSFSVVLRAHTCLASMAGRGTDPGLLLPPGATTSAEVSTRWHGGWMAAVGRFLLGIENPVGASLAAGEAGKGRERETVEKLLEDEIARTIEGRPSSRAEFLSRFARIVHHYDVVKPIAAAQSAPITEIKPSKKLSPAVLPQEPMLDEGQVPPVEVTLPGGAIAAALGGMALTQGVSTPKPDKPNVGFAEILFKGGGDDLAPPDEPDWARRRPADGSVPTQFEAPNDPTPVWLKAAVFILGSMTLGGSLAHLSGNALWQNLKPTPPVLEVPEESDAASAASDLKKLSPTTNSSESAAESEPPGVKLRPPPASSLKSKLVD
jgi:hypothetical protein